MRIPLQKAFEILQDASAIIIDDDVVVYPSMSKLKDDESNEFMSLHWEVGGLTYDIAFTEGDNEEVSVYGSSMFLHDTFSDMAESSTTQITILVPQILETESLKAIGDAHRPCKSFWGQP